MLLAVFLSFWTWLYTFERNQWKFWTGLAAGVTVVVLFIVGAVQRSHDTAFLCQAYHQQCAGGGYDAVAFLIGLGVWIWAIIDVSTKSYFWYGAYSNGGAAPR